MWKTGPQPRTKPVIARDTTCSVSLLTATICGSNFAIPSTKIPPHGNGTEFQSNRNEGAVRCQPEVTWLPPQARKVSGAWASRSVSPAPETLNETASSQSGTHPRKPEADFECGGRSPILPPGHDNNRKCSRNCSTVICNLPAGRQGNVVIPSMHFLRSEGSGRAAQGVVFLATQSSRVWLASFSPASQRGPRSPQWKV